MSPAECLDLIDQIDNITSRLDLTTEDKKVAKDDIFNQILEKLKKN